MIYKDDLKKNNFQFFQYINLDQSMRLTISNGNFKNSVYAILVDNKLVYIGKTKNFRKRFDTYRNCINWVSCMPNNRLKTQLLTQLILNNNVVEIWYRPAIFVQEFTDYDNDSIEISTLLDEERKLIKKFQPEWNIQHAKN